MEGILNIWGTPNYDDWIERALGAHAAKHGVAGAFGVCVAAVICSTPTELIGRDAAYILDLEHSHFAHDELIPGLGTTLARFWVAVAADDLDMAWALFLGFGGDPYDHERLGALVTLVISTGVINVAGVGPASWRVQAVWHCDHCGRDSANPHDVREGYCGACHHFCGEVA